MSITSHFIFKHPFTCMIAGPTSSGKTVLVEKIIENRTQLIPGLSPRSRILWCYGQWQPGYDKPGIIYHEGLNEDPKGYDLIIIDDLMNELGSDAALLNLFTKGSHHLKISVVFIVQNIFHQAKFMRNISRNCQYLMIMKNPRDRSQIYHLGRQLYPRNSKEFIKIYEDATQTPYSYIKLDLTATTPDIYRIKTNIIPIGGRYKIKVFSIE